MSRIHCRYVDANRCPIETARNHAADYGTICASSLVSERAGAHYDSCGWISTDAPGCFTRISCGAEWARGAEPSAGIRAISKIIGWPSFTGTNEGAWQAVTSYTAAHGGSSRARFTDSASRCLRGKCIESRVSGWAQARRQARLAESMVFNGSDQVFHQ